MKKVHRLIKFNQKAWLKPYIDMNTTLRKKAKSNFKKDFFSLMNNAVFGKTMENVRKHRNIKLVTTEKRRNYLVSEPNHHTKTFFRENLIAIEMRKTEPVYLRFSILDLIKTIMYEFWYDYVKPDILKICYMDTGSFIVYVKTEDIYKNKAEDIWTRFDTNFELDRSLPEGKIKK